MHTTVARLLIQDSNFERPENLSKAYKQNYLVLQNILAVFRFRSEVPEKGSQDLCDKSKPWNQFVPHSYFRAVSLEGNCTIYAVCLPLCILQHQWAHGDDPDERIRKGRASGRCTQHERRPLPMISSSIRVLQWRPLQRSIPTNSVRKNSTCQ